MECERTDHEKADQILEQEDDRGRRESSVAFTKRSSPRCKRTIGRSGRRRTLGFQGSDLHGCWAR